MRLALTLLKIQNQLRIYHWQAKSFAQHEAFGKAYKEIDSLIDDFVESYIGRHGGSNEISVTYKFELTSFNDDYSKFVEDCKQFFTDMSSELSDTETELLNLRDEMLGIFTKLEYLLRLT